MKLPIAETIANLDALSRRRALTLQESLRLERALKSHAQGANPNYRWTQEEDQRALEMRGRGLSHGIIARRLNRSPYGVAARLRQLGGREGEP